MGSAFDADGGVKSEGREAEEVISRDDVDGLGGGVEVEEGLDEGNEVMHWAWVDGVEDYRLLLCG